MFEIQGRKIGYDYDPLVIAEVGINHGGSLTVAKEMVDAAQRAGAEIIKHQTHIIEDEMSSEARSIKPGNADISIYEIMQHCALNEEEEIEMQRYVNSKGMIFMSSPFSRAAVDRLQRMDVPAFKIGSGECNNYPLLNHIASLGKPVILSTGMNTIESIKKATSIFEKHKVPFCLLHTTNLYPTPNSLVRLGAMVEMSNHFPGIPFGLSDHTLSNHACLGAVALGASILERHFTDHMQRVGPDIICSMDEKACADLIEGSKIIKQQRGGLKGPLKEEQVTIDFAFASVCTINPVAKGEKFTKDNLWVKRPGTGDIKAELYESVIGKVASRDLENDIQLKLSDISEG
ncbi:N-acetylneuraminate synthase family protein [Roseivirga echinicomitans]|uniref:Polyhydroxyalkanoate biosynthesis repressor PhaR n=1 Tax=Roseivirga echinicomitans TaxID=296218 RepID=A0A150XVR5_9BACT|nr:N-acetylneuraminate synthase family protein [Roseivirga echinicomitans]KYG82840.1 polyhydroxyalkanoate biosynthesis repressor PhaR [Roseivirga echinicomitans]